MEDFFGADLSRRDLGGRLAALAAFTAMGASVGAAAETAAGEAPETGHDMAATPPHWIGKEQIAFLIYPDFTALDMVGPHYMLSSLMGATTHIVAKTLDLVKSDAGLVFKPSATFDDCPADLDVICVPGGTLGTLAAIRDDATMAFLRDRGSRAKYVTSVCTGSLVLAAAGLLDGYKATSHWLTRPLLGKLGAIPVDARVVRDRNRITGAGVTAGVDFGLGLIGDMRDRHYAEAVQLLAEYAPEPPFDAGAPATAPKEAKQILDGMFQRFLVTAEETVTAARHRSPVSK